MARSQSLLIHAAALSLFTACGGSEPPPQTPQTEAVDDDEDSVGHIGAMAEIGGMPEEETVAAFRGAFGPIQQCFVAGARRIEYLGGEIALQVRVGQKGKVQAVFAERSSIGDRQTERCMFEALEHADWPAPVGGLVGIAQNSFEFEMTGDVRGPVIIDNFDSAEALAPHLQAIRDCKGASAGSFTATVYVDTDGSPLAAGIAAPNADAESKSDCLVGVLEQATFPSPGSWAGKVTFSL